MLESALSPAGVNGADKPFRGVRSRFLPKIRAIRGVLTMPNRLAIVTANYRIAKGSFDHSSAGSSNAQCMVGMRVPQLERVGDGAISDVAAVNI